MAQAIVYRTRRPQVSSGLPATGAVHAPPLTLPDVAPELDALLAQEPSWPRPRVLMGLVVAQVATKRPPVLLAVVNEGPPSEAWPVWVEGGSPFRQPLPSPPVLVVPALEPVPPPPSPQVVDAQPYRQPVPAPPVQVGRVIEPGAEPGAALTPVPFALGAQPYRQPVPCPPPVQCSVVEPPAPPPAPLLFGVAPLTAVTARHVWAPQVAAWPWVAPLLEAPAPVVLVGPGSTVSAHAWGPAVQVVAQPAAAVEVLPGLVIGVPLPKALAGLLPVVLVVSAGEGVAESVGWVARSVFRPAPRAPVQVAPADVLPELPIPWFARPVYRPSLPAVLSVVPQAWVPQEPAAWVTVVTGATARHVWAPRVLAAPDGSDLAGLVWATPVVVVAAGVHAGAVVPLPLVTGVSDYAYTQGGAFDFTWTQGGTSDFAYTQTGNTNVIG